METALQDRQEAARSRYSMMALRINFGLVMDCERIHLWEGKYQASFYNAGVSSLSK
jgi:hypothetical protein